MNKMFLSVFTLILILHASLSMGNQEQIVLSEIQNRYEKTNDLEANFVQEYIGKVMKQANRGEGKVYFKKKGMMRWDYRTPYQKLISDGQTLWYYQPEEKQVIISDISKMIKEYGFLMGEGDLKRDFKLAQLKESKSFNDNIYVIELLPKEPHPALAKLVLTVEKKNFYIIQTDVIDEVGNITRTRFSDIKINTNLPSYLFHFTIPPGVEVLRMEGASSTGGKRDMKK